MGKSPVRVIETLRYRGIKIKKIQYFSDQLFLYSLKGNVRYSINYEYVKTAIKAHQNRYDEIRRLA